MSILASMQAVRTSNICIMLCLHFRSFLTTYTPADAPRGGAGGGREVVVEGEFNGM